MKHITRILCIGIVALSFTACSKDDDKTSDTDTTSGATVNALVLNEGVWGSNNASITGLNAYNGDIDADWFENANAGRPLGDVAQDMVKYGTKVYATVTFSNSLEVIDPSTGTSTRIDMGSRNPRHIAADGGKLYISCYNPCSVVRVDTASLAIEATCVLGDFHPEGIAIAQGKAFVASQVTSDYQTYDSVLYVIDLASFANPQTITVGLNPGTVKKIDDNRILVAYTGNYNDVMGGSAIVDVNTLNVTQTNREMAGAAIYDGTIYAYASTWVEDPETHEWNQTVGFFSLNPSTLTAAPLSFLSGIANPYGIDINPSNGNLYVSESLSGANGNVHCYTKNGEHRFTAEAGIFPKKVVFLK